MKRYIPSQRLVSPSFSPNRTCKFPSIRFSILVSCSEYATRDRFGFVIDADRHDAYDGPSSFASRQGRAG